MNWPHQDRTVAEVLALIAQGHTRILVTCPTGGGKTRIMGMLAQAYVGWKRKVLLYTNRKLLVAQTSEVFGGLDIEHGVRAAGYEHEQHLDVQVSSIQTEDARVNKSGVWELFPADLVLVDEAHLIKAAVAQGLFAKHEEAGGVIVGFTATPLDLGEVYKTLVIGATTSECRNCGALVLAKHYGPDEPDLEALKRLRKKLPAEGEDFSEQLAKLAMMNPTLFGRVFDWFEKLNPDRRPTLLFAPGVQESLWFAEQFTKQGVPAAHLAAGEVWYDGQYLDCSTPSAEMDARKKVLDDSRKGLCEVLCNRFLLREGVDAPWLSHGIFATIFGSPQSYLQAGGRLLRSYPGKDFATIQDHGGNWHRAGLGSLNLDRQWQIHYTAGMYAGIQADRFRQKKEREAARCPRCARIFTGGKCECGYEIGPRKSRPVITMDGEYKEMVGDVYRPRRMADEGSGLRNVWAKMYFRSLKGKGVKTFRAAEALFAYENNWTWPNRDWPFMPIDDDDRFRLIPDVPRERLK